MFKKLGTIAVTLFLLVVALPHANAAEYSYWSYWHGKDGKWASSNEGASFIPADGTVEGWRYVKTADTDPAPEPRLAADFAEICANFAPKAGMKRVGIVLDYGTVAGSGGETEQPVSSCVQVSQDADGFAILNFFSSIGVDKGMVCSVDSVPTGGCPSNLPGKSVHPGTVHLNGSEKVETVKKQGNPYLAGGLILLVAGLVIGLAQLRKSRK